ncbi:hypothetical protein C8J56DRAFT_1125883 [Mycena floridula]|nr:hypothetical protein C8J56DRAFT_1125883 [Mycena floridula]
MSAEQILAIKDDFNRFLWQPTDNAGGYIRPLCGAELAQNAFNRFNKGYQVLFFATYVDVATPIPRDELIAAAGDSWIALRHQIPMIASPNIDNVKTWADRTFVVYDRDQLDLNKLREEVGGSTIPSEAGDNCWLRFVPGTAIETEIIKFGVLLHTNHSLFDDAAVRILMNEYLMTLAK